MGYDKLLLTCIASRRVAGLAAGGGIVTARCAPGGEEARASPDLLDLLPTVWIMGLLQVHLPPRARTDSPKPQP